MSGVFLLVLQHQFTPYYWLHCITKFEDNKNLSEVKDACFFLNVGFHQRLPSTFTLYA